LSLLQDFKSAATGVAAKAMRNELNAMIQKIDDPEYKKVRTGLAEDHRVDIRPVPRR
jgi:hypothetical protein